MSDFMTSGTIFAVTAWLCVCIFDIHQHNKRVEEDYPDDQNQKHREMRNRYHLNPFGFYAAVAVLLFFAIRSLFS